MLGNPITYPHQGEDSSSKYELKELSSPPDTGTFILESSNKKGVEDAISADKEAFKASVPSFIETPLPKKEAAKPDKPPPLVFPISGESVTPTVYFSGILIATITPINNPIPAAL